jgi:hypothetical protein
MKFAHIGIVTMVVSSTLIGCSGTTRTQEVRSGVRGRVVLEGMGGVPLPDGSPNITVTALPNTTVTIEASTTSARYSVTSDSEGKFDVSLAPGDYVFTLPLRNDIPATTPRTTNVRVVAESFTETTLRYQVAYP